MKGIKECLRFMLDNEGKRIENGPVKLYFENGMFIKYVETFDVFESTLNKLTTHFFDFNILKEGEWTEVIQPVDFITAYNDCKENNCSYKNNKIPTIRMFGHGGIVTIVDNKEYGNTTTLDGEWVKCD